MHCFSSCPQGIWRTDYSVLLFSSLIIASYQGPAPQADHTAYWVISRIHSGAEQSNLKQPVVHSINSPWSDPERPHISSSSVNLFLQLTLTPFDLVSLVFTQYPSVYHLCLYSYLINKQECYRCKAATLRLRGEMKKCFFLRILNNEVKVLVLNISHMGQEIKAL